MILCPKTWHKGRLYDLMKLKRRPLIKEVNPHEIVIRGKIRISTPMNLFTQKIPKEGRPKMDQRPVALLIKVNRRKAHPLEKKKKGKPSINND